ncbi:MAG: TIGR01212 family radical SAM protein [Lachnospiraceae bacterium]|nr:TIGR01212 family radical SAM protein [Lachnospiraceae bacterium]
MSTPQEAFDPQKKIAVQWHGKRYYSLEAYLKNHYGYRIKKLSLDAGFTCPNRDGTLDTRGCIFCSAGGSGEFAVAPVSAISTEPYIAYFQAYTCTYGPRQKLEALYRNALEQPLVRGISIATRPDCLPLEVLSLLEQLHRDYPEKFIWIELGLQTIHEQTALYIRRGYTLDCFQKAVYALDELSLPVIVHTILGLPGEDKAMMLATMEYLNTLPISGIKLQLLHILRGTDLALDYEKGLFKEMTMDEYVEILIQCIERLSPHIVIHRVTGDGPKDLLIAPIWSTDKKKVLNTLHHRMKLQNSYQGKYQNMLRP